MRVLVTGGAGFLGTHVAKTLKRYGHEVVVFDLKEPPVKDEFVAGELTSLDDCLRVTQGADVICHLGAIGDVYLAFEKPYLAAAVNVQGTANILEAALRNRVEKVVYTSTWEVYGKPRYQPVDEAHPCDPDHPYNITKLAGERLALAYDHLKGLKTVALRLGTAYGGGMRPNSVFSLFISRAQRGEPIVIKGDGSQYRQFTHASDIAQAFRLAMESDIHGDVFNIVAEEKTSIRDLAELVVDMFPTPINYEPARVGDIEPALISSRKARHSLRWEPTISIKQGLRELAKGYLND